MTTHILGGLSNKLKFLITGYKRKVAKLALAKFSPARIYHLSPVITLHYFLDCFKIYFVYVVELTLINQYS